MVLSEPMLPNPGGEKQNYFFVEKKGEAIEIKAGVGTSSSPIQFQL